MYIVCCRMTTQMSLMILKMIRRYMKWLIYRDEFWALQSGSFVLFDYHSFVRHPVASTRKTVSCHKLELKINYTEFNGKVVNTFVIVMWNGALDRTLFTYITDCKDKSRKRDPKSKVWKGWVLALDYIQDLNLGINFQ